MNQWLPDWRDPSSYPDIETTSLHEWAWEFLRRNPSYQVDFQALVSELEQIKYNEAHKAYPEAIKAKVSERRKRDSEKLDELDETLEKGQNIMPFGQKSKTSPVSTSDGILK